jgi:hypothetical protein
MTELVQTARGWELSFVFIEFVIAGKKIVLEDDCVFVEERRWGSSVF